jgi:hypothetical protein
MIQSKKKNEMNFKDEDMRKIAKLFYESGVIRPEAFRQLEWIYNHSKK